MSISFYHVADIHLNRPFSSLAATAGLAVKRRQELFDGFCEILLRAKKEKPDFLLITGDLYEHGYTGINTIGAINDLFKKLSTKVIMIGGNHDPVAKNSWYKQFSWADNVYIADRENPSIFFKDKNICFYGIGYDTGGGQMNLLERISTDSSYTNVLLMHGDIDVDISSYNSVSSRYIMHMGFDYVAMGHNHKKYIKEKIHNPGSLFALGFDEHGEHGWFKGDFITGEVEYVETLSRKYADIEMPYDRLGDFAEEYPDKRDLYRIKITGESDKKISSKLFEDYDFVTVIDARTGPELQIEVKDNLSYGIIKRYENILKEKIVDADERDKAVYRQALKIGLSALNNEEPEMP